MENGLKRLEKFRAQTRTTEMGDGRWRREKKIERNIKSFLFAMEVIQVSQDLCPTIAACGWPIGISKINC